MALSLASYIAARLGVGQAPYLASVPSPVESTPGPRRVRISGGGTAIHYGTIDDIDHNADVRGSKWYGSLGDIGISGKMLRDPHVRQSIAYVSDPLRCADWRFKPASKDPRHIEQADFLTWAFVERLNWDSFIKRAVTGYCADGFALFEMTDDTAPLPATRFQAHGAGACIVPTGLHEIPANTVERWIARKGAPTELREIEQWVPFSDVDAGGYRTIPADRIVRFTFDQVGGNFAGLSILRSAFQPWKVKLALLAIEAIKHERTGVGTPVVILGEQVSDEDIDAAQKTLEQLRANAKGFAVFPNGWEFKWEGTSSSDGPDIGTVIERCNKDIAVNVSAGFMLLGLTGGNGSYALGATQQSQYHLSIVGHSRLIGNVMTLGVDGWSPARRILELNYGPVDAMPTLEARNLPTRNWLDVLPQIINATNVGLITADDRLEDELRSVLQVGPRDEATTRKRAPLAGAAGATMADDEPVGDDEEAAEDDATDADATEPQDTAEVDDE